MAQTQKVDWERWKSKPLWDEKELQALCCGLEPDRSRASNVELNEVAEDIKRAVLAGDLQMITNPNLSDGGKLYGAAFYIRPSDAIRWAAPLYPKFELKHVPPISIEDTNTSARERKTLLKIIGAIAMVLAEGRNKYRSGDTPNALQIADAAGAIVDALPDKNKHGLSNANIRAKITEGLKLLSE